MSPLGKSSATLGMSVSDHWHGMASRKSHVTELKNWMAMHSKTKKTSVRVELRTGGDPPRSEKLGWSAGDMRQLPKQKMYRHPVSPTGVLLLAFLTCSKAAK